MFFSTNSVSDLSNLPLGISILSNASANNMSAELPLIVQKDSVYLITIGVCLEHECIRVREIFYPKVFLGKD